MAKESISLPKLDRSNIEWTGASWNPWQGCIKVSAGCKFCYMYRDKKRYGKDPSKVIRSADATFLKPLKWQKEVERGIRTGTDRYVFTCSWSDWFIEQADGWRAEAWDVVRRCPGLIFQILTKRPERIADRLPEFWTEIKDRCWIGTSVENQEAADARIQHLLRCPAGVRFLSVEPLLGPVVLDEICTGPDDGSGWTYRHWNSLTGDNWCDCRDFIKPVGTGPISWVIVGGESGPEARPMHPAWARSIRDQCAAAGVPFFFKQWGEFEPSIGPGNLYVSERDGSTSQWPDRDDKVAIRKVGKKAAGRLLDGVTHDGFPAAREAVQL